MEVPFVDVLQERRQCGDQWAAIVGGVKIRRGPRASSEVDGYLGKTVDRQSHGAKIYCPWGAWKISSVVSNFLMEGVHRRARLVRRTAESRTAATKNSSRQIEIETPDLAC
jgi:hypothetical protein